MRFCATATLLACLAGSALATPVQDGVASLEALVQQMASGGGGAMAQGIEQRDLEGLEALLEHMRMPKGPRRVEQRDVAGLTELQALVDHIKTAKASGRTSDANANSKMTAQTGETRRVDGRHLAELEALLEHVKTMVDAASQMPGTTRPADKMAAGSTRRSGGGTPGQADTAAGGTRMSQRSEPGTPGRGSNAAPGGTPQRVEAPNKMPDAASPERGLNVDALAASVADHLRSVILANGQFSQDDRIVMEAIASAISRKTGRTVDTKMVESLLQGKMVL